MVFIWYEHGDKGNVIEFVRRSETQVSSRPHDPAALLEEPVGVLHGLEHVVADREVNGSVFNGPGLPGFNKVEFIDKGVFTGGFVHVDADDFPAFSF